jgi:hypothetical protein
LTGRPASDTLPGVAVLLIPIHRKECPAMVQSGFLGGIDGRRGVAVLAVFALWFGSAAALPATEEAAVEAAPKPRDSERMVVGALVWLARHQAPDGSWSLTRYTRQCKDTSCAGSAASNTDSAATALGVLPFLAAGQSHKDEGPYQKSIARGLTWLVKHQKADGDLMGGDTMYSHGLATIALCEAYGLTQDEQLCKPAQSAVDFIVKAQNRDTGGWRYKPQEDGDTCVLGWQVAALRSAELAGLKVDPAALTGAGKWLDSVAGGPARSEYAYRPKEHSSTSMNAVGLLARVRLGAKRNDPMIAEGVKFFDSYQLDRSARDVYSWFFATQFMHNAGGDEWAKWNRNMRKRLIESQNRNSDECANGSWDPASPAKDVWGIRGGRLMMTSLSCLTAEVYYRYLPLFKPEKRAERKQSVPSQ